MPAPLPDPLLPRDVVPLEVLRSAGFPASRLRHRRLVRPTRGLRALAPLDGQVALAHGYALVLPGDVAYSHVTAAALLGLPLPHHLESTVLLDVMRDGDRPRIRRTGCAGHRGLERREVVVVDGLPVVGPLDTWCDLGEVLARRVTRDDLVVAGDAVVNRAPGGLADLAAVLQARVRPRGAVTLREALALVRLGVRSPMETRARLMFVGAGFPEPEVNAPILDGAGTWLLEGDLVWRRERVVAEYQGSDHAARERRSADAHRAGLARDQGWTVVELFAEDVLRPARRITTLVRVARELGLDVRDLRIA